MSFTAEGWAWQQKTASSAAKYVLICLGWYANEVGENAYPSIRTICLRTQLNERTVRKAIGDLVVAGLVEVEQRTAPNGRDISNRYRLMFVERAPAKMQDQFVVGEAPVEMQDASCKSAAPPEPDPLQKCSGPPADVQGNPLLEQEERKIVELRSTAPAVPDAPKPPPDVRKQLFDEGCVLLREQCGVLRSKAGGLIKRFLDAADGDASLVLKAMKVTASEGLPGGGFVPYVFAIIANRTAREPKFRDPAVEMAYRTGNLDPEKRAAFNATLTRDYSAWERGTTNG